MKNIRNAAKKALLTTKQSIDNIKFKRDIAKSLKDDLYNQIKMCFFAWKRSRNFDIF